MVSNPPVMCALVETPQYVQRPDLVPAIVVTFLCFWPLGLAAVYLAMRVRTLFTTYIIHLLATHAVVYFYMYACTYIIHVCISHIRGCILGYTCTYTFHLVAIHATQINKYSPQNALLKVIICTFKIIIHSS